MTEKKDTFDPAQMLTIQDVAKLIKSSDRHVTNLRKQRRIPEPAIVGKRNVRWPRNVIEDWILAGCPALAV